MELGLKRHLSFVKHFSVPMNIMCKTNVKLPTVNKNCLTWKWKGKS